CARRLLISFPDRVARRDPEVRQDGVRAVHELHARRRVDAYDARPFAAGEGRQNAPRGEIHGQRPDAGAGLAGLDPREQRRRGRERLARGVTAQIDAGSFEKATLLVLRGQGANVFLLEVKLEGGDGKTQGAASTARASSPDASARTRSTKRPI